MSPSRFSASDWLRALRHGKALYRLPELARLAGLSLPAARQATRRLRARGWLAYVGKGLFANLAGPRTATLEDLAAILYPPSYISLESALFQHGVLDQAPHVLTCVSLNKTKRFRTELGELWFRRIKPDLFFGFQLQDAVPLALAEKALLDRLYLDGEAGLEELNLGELDFARLRRWAEPYPARVRRGIRGLERSGAG